MAEEVRHTPFWSTVGLALTGQFGVSMSNQGFSALIPFVQTALSLTKSQVGFFSSVAQLGTILSFYGGGWIADRFGVRPLILAATTAVGLGLIGLSFASGYGIVLGVLFLTGIGTGLGGPAVTMMIIHNFERRRRGTAMGVKQTGVPGVGLAAAFIIPPVAVAFGWRPATFGMGVLAILLGLWVFWRYRDHSPVDAARQAREGEAGSVRSILTNRNIQLVSLFAAALVALQFCVLTYFILFLSRDLGWDVVTAGQFLGLVQFGGVAGRIVWGLVSDRLLAGRRKPVFVVAGLIAALLAVSLAFLTSETPPWTVAFISFSIGMSALGWHGLSHALVAELVSPQLAGQAVGVTMTMSQIGPIAGPPVFGLIVDLTGLYQPAWLLFAALAGAATVVLACFLHEAPPARRERLTEEATPSGSRQPVIPETPVARQ